MDEVAAILKECFPLDASSAIAVLNDALKVHSNADLYYARGNALDEVGSYDLALSDFTEAIRLKPEVSFLLAKGRLLTNRLDNPELGLNDYLLAYDIDPDNTLTHEHLCLCYLLLGQTTKASHHAYFLIDTDTSNGSFYLHLGRCLFAEERYNGAAEKLRMAVNLDPLLTFGWILLASSLRSIGQLEEAKSCIEKSLQIETLATNSISYASLLIELKQPEKALEYLQLAESFSLSEGYELLVESYRKDAQELIHKTK